MLTGPREATTAFVRNNYLLVVDGHADIWTYDPAITAQDEHGNDVVAPTDFARAEVGRDGSKLMVIDNAGTSWIYDMNTGSWLKSNNVDEKLEGEDENTQNPWKRGKNAAVALPPEDDAAAPAKRSKSKSHAREDA